MGNLAVLDRDELDIDLVRKGWSLVRGQDFRCSLTPLSHTEKP